MVFNILVILFCQVFKVFSDNKYFGKSSIGYERWRYYVNSLGFGVSLGVDLPNEYSGFVPTSEYYNRLKGETGKLTA